MKISKPFTRGIFAAAALLLAGTAQLQATTNFVVAAFATGTQGQNNSQDGSYGQYAGDNLSVPYGAGTIAWDGITFDAADGSTGSAYITANFSGANNTDVLVSMGPGYNNWYYEGGSASCPTGTVDFTKYHAVQFDILWDTNSTLSIAQFNTGQGWPAAYLQPGLGADYMATNSYYTHGVNVEMFTGSGGGTVSLGTFQIPTNADKGWQTVTMPYSDSLAGIGAGAGLWFEGAFGGGSGISGGPYTGSFWIDNLVLVGNVTLSAPPTLSAPTPATPGLNIFNATEGNSFYDRNEVLATTTSGLSWVGNTPATYSFNLAGFPKGGANFSGEAYLIMVANSVNQDNGADYNESNVVILEIQSTGTGGQAALTYKVGLPNSETYTAVSFSNVTGPSAPTNATVTSIPSANILGTYTLTFTGNDTGTLTGPDGTSGTFTLPANLAETYFAETGSEPYNFLMYLGGQANSAGYMGKSVTYSSVTVTGPPSGGQVSEDFLNDANNGLPLQNWAKKWTGNQTSDPSAVVLVPTNAPYWVSWSLPASGFSLAHSGSLQNPNWQNVTTYNPISMFSTETQLISANDLDHTNAEYFLLVARVATQLQVLLPGETAAPGTATGKTGTPTPVSVGAGGLITVTVNAVDKNWYPVGGITDLVQVTSSDPNAVPPNNANLVNGTMQFTMSLGSAGTSPTITATDLTDPNKTANTSTPVSVTP